MALPFIRILKPAPAADVIDQNGLEIRLAGSDLCHQVLQRLATVQPQPGPTGVLEDAQDLQAPGGGVIPNDVELVLCRVLLGIGGNPHIGDGWDILSGLVTFVLAVVSTVIQIGFSFSAFFGFDFLSGTNSSGKSFPETGKVFPFARRSFFKLQFITEFPKSVMSVKRGPMIRKGQNRLAPFSWFFNFITKKDVKMRVKMGTVVPKMGTFVHLVEEPTDYRTAIAMALHEELDDTHRAIKMAMRWTGASERTVKYWFSGERGPSGDHLIALARHSDAVLYVVLALAGRHIVEEADD